MQFYLTSLRRKEYFAKRNQLSGAGPCFFGPFEPEPSRKKMPGAGAAWEKNQEPEPLEKKSEAGADLKLAGSPTLK